MAVFRFHLGIFMKLLDNMNLHESSNNTLENNQIFCQFLPEIYLEQYSWLISVHIECCHRQIELY